MPSTVEKVSSNQVKLTFEVPADEFAAAIQKAYLQNRGRIQVPGFRRGKAPRKVIERMYGDTVFHEDAFNDLVPDIYDAAIEEHHLFPVDQPSVDSIEQMEEGKDLKFTMTVYVKPEVTLGQYEGLKAVQYVHQVTDEEIDQRIQQDVDKATTLEDVTDRNVEQGDTVNLNYAGTVDGVAFDGGTAENQTLEIGSGMFIPGFEDQLVGMAISEEKDINVTFPESYQSKELEGKAAVFHVRINGIQTKVKPELDDEFAADVSDFSTFAEYRQSISDELSKKAQRNADVQLENDLIQQVTDAADCDIPAAMIDREIQLMIRQLKMNMMYQGLRYEDYLKYTGQTEEQVSDMYRSEATNRVKMQLVLEAIVEKENPEITDEDVDKQVAEQAESANTTVEAYRERLSDASMEAIRENAKLRKIVDKIVASAEVEKKDDKDRVNVGEVADDVMQVLEDNTEEAEEGTQE